MSHITRVVTIGVLALCACVDAEEASIAEQALAQLNGSQLNGSQLNGSQLNGSQLNGMNLLGFWVGGATKEGDGLMNLRVEKGELVAERSSVTLRGTDFAGVELRGYARNASAQPTTYATVDYRITAVAAEDAGYDPLGTGNTFLYTLDYWNGTGWVDACPQDYEGRRVAIPLAAEWDETGNRTDSSFMFTLACTTGVIAKCYRWGYRPWVTGRGDLETAHWTCTRLARADYCGSGISHTTDGTHINIWDKLAPPIQEYAVYAGAVFDAAWSTGGATCLSATRWSQIGSTISAECPGKLPAPGQNGTACNSEADALAQNPAVMVFRELLP